MWMEQLLLLKCKSGLNKMSILKRIKANKPTVGLEGYFFTILGKSKVGKTTFVYDLVDEYYEGDFSKALLLGAEVGYKTLDGVHAIAITDFYRTDDEDKEELESYGFMETVDDLIENRKELGYKLVIIDTITALEELAIKHVLKVESRKAGKRFTAISDIPFGKGYNMVAEAIYSQIDRLKKSGIAVFVIGHETVKQIENKDGSTYNYITFNAQKKTTDIIEREADMIMYVDLETKVEDGNVSQKRYLRFRSDGNIICGSRFRTMPEKIELDVKEFLNTFKVAVEASFKNKGEIGAVKKEQAEKAEKVIQYNMTKEPVVEMSKEEMIEEIGKIIPTLDAEKVNDFKGALKAKFDKINYKTFTDEQLVEVLKIAKEL